MADFHDKPFDTATRVKLEIYKRYVEEWLPVFITQSNNKFIKIYDFFCGPGIDVDGERGSPLLALDVCKSYSQLIDEYGVTVELFFNDKSKSKILSLEKTLAEVDLPGSVRYETSSEDFSTCFLRQIRNISSGNNLLFIDQCGIKEINSSVFNTLVGLRRTDFIFFIASSTVKRFQNSPEFKAYLDTENIFPENMKHYDAHRAIAEMYRRMIPKDEKYYLAPFSIKKARNIYGLVFGSSHTLGLEKFLRIAWDLDPERGEANFDIDSDNLPHVNESLDMFKDNDRSTKVSKFQEELEMLISDGMLVSDKEVFLYSIESGFIPTKHARPVVKNLKDKGVISVEGQVRLSKACLKEPRGFRLLQ